MIKLNITRIVDNPNYDKEYDDRMSERGMGGMYSEKYDDISKRQKTITAGVLDVEITEEQFEAIRKAVLEKF